MGECFIHRLGDVARGGRVDGRAVDKEARLWTGREFRLLQDGLVDGLDVMGFGEAGDYYVLCCPDLLVVVVDNKLHGLKE